MANEFVIKNGYFSQGNSNVTGSLQVTGSVGVTGSASITGSLTSIGTSSFSGSILMTGSLNAIVSGAIDLTGFITASKIFITSSGNEQLMVIGSGSSSWITGIYGSQGNLLTVTDTFSGSIFTVTDISGYPILDVTSNYYTSSINTVGFLNHTGSAGVTGSLIVSGGFEVYDAFNELKNINSDLRSLYDAGGAISINWDTRVLSDGTAYVLNWQDRVIYYSDGTTEAINWNTQDQILVSGSIIPGGPYVSNTSSYDLGSPTAAWNKIYVSNNSLHFVSGSVSASIGFNGGFISFTSASLSLPTLTTSSQQYVVTYNSESGQLFYTASSAIGGGSSTFNSTSSFLGNGLSSSFNINHGFNTLNLHITVYSASGTYETVYPDIRRINVNTASVIFANPPSTDQYIVYISQ